jgi:ATP-binding cassette subfamily B protein
MDRSLQLARVEAWFQPLIMLLIAVSTLLVVLMGGYQVYAGKLTPGNIAEFILYVNMLTWPVTSIGWIASIVQEAEASQKRINELLETNPAIKSNSDAHYRLEGDIVFQNVSYTYPDTGVKALKNISFSLKKGEKMAILGRTASGKSTIADLLLRVFDPTEGQIFIDGKEIREHNIHMIRQQFGYVPQDAFLFSDTVASNIAFGKVASSREEIIEYAEFASVHDDIERLPQGYETMVGERGVTLSGGQKQRIAIARALIKDPEIVILDDALSAVDSSTEQKILGYLRDALHAKTSIVITHRANNLLEYDKILVLDNGEIVEKGTHEELIKSNGFYASVYDHQLLHA